MRVPLSWFLHVLASTPASPPHLDDPRVFGLCGVLFFGMCLVFRVIDNRTYVHPFAVMAYTWMFGGMLEIVINLGLSWEAQSLQPFSAREPYIGLWLFLGVTAALGTAGGFMVRRLLGKRPLPHHPRRRRSC